MMKLRTKRAVSLLLLCTMLLTLCGCGQRDTNKPDDASSAPAKLVDPSAVGDALLNDEEIVSHIKNNANINTHREVRTAHAFRLIIANTQTMTGFVTSNVATEYQQCLSGLMSVASEEQFITKDAYLLVKDEETGDVQWENRELDKQLGIRAQKSAFYEGIPLPQEGALGTLADLGREAFPEKALTVIVSNFVEPGNDLNALSAQIEAYFDRYDYSAVCVMGFTSQFRGLFHIPSNELANPTFYIGNNTDERDRFEGKAPFYLVMIGPENAVRDAVTNINDRLEQYEIRGEYCIYTNSLYQQVLTEPLTFDVIGDLKKRKAPVDTIRSYNTGTLVEHNSGNVYYSGILDRVETLDQDSGDAISTSTQISVMSTDYDGVSQYDNWDYQMYAYDPDTGSWEEAGKNDLANATVVIQPESGDDLAEELILAQGRREIRVSAKLSFKNGLLSKNTIYRLTVRLFLNSENAAIEKMSSDGLTRKFDISRTDYDAAVNQLANLGGNNKSWTSTGYMQDDVQLALLRTPNLKQFITSLEKLVEKYHDNSDMIEYLDFVFNVPNSKSGT